MAFLLHQSDRLGTQSTEYVPGSARKFQIGEVLMLTAGLLALAAVDSTGEQTYICAGDKEVETSGELVPVYRITPERVYATDLTADGSALKVGDKVTLSSGRKGVTATTASGVFEIVAMDGDAAGDTVYGRFA